MSQDLQNWNALADGWSKWVGTNDNRVYVLDPAHLKQLGDVKGKRILDAGCGEGRFARMLTERGAKVTAFDFSPRMVELASEIETKSPLGIDYNVADMTDLSRFPDASFDIAVAYLTLIDVYDYERAIIELARVLRPAGTFLFSLVHPCFMTPGAHWASPPGVVPIWDKDKLYKKVDGYYPAREIRFKMWPTAPVETINYHRPLADYTRACRDAGLLIREIVEPYPTEEVMAQRDWLREFYRAPPMMVIDCVKPS